MATEGPRRIRKLTGHFLEDFRPGQVFRHKGGKTVTEGLFAIFTEFAMTSNPLAKNARYARAYGFQGLVCPPGLSVGFRASSPDLAPPLPGPSAPRYRSGAPLRRGRRRARRTGCGGGDTERSLGTPTFPVNNLVYAATGTSVRTVLIDGRSCSTRDPSSR